MATKTKKVKPQESFVFNSPHVRPDEKTKIKYQKTRSIETIINEYSCQNNQNANFINSCATFEVHILKNTRTCKTNSYDPLGAGSQGDW